MRTVLLVEGESSSFWGAIVEGYLRFYAGRLVEIYSWSKDGKAVVHPLVRQIMDEDGIDMSVRQAHSWPAGGMKQLDIAILPDGHTVPSRIRVEKVHRLLPEHAEVDLEGEDALGQLRHRREQIKSHLLHFIGKELLSSSV